jgi:hypothetical protein
VQGAAFCSKLVMKLRARAIGTRAALLLSMAACGGRSALPIGAGGHGGATTTGATSTGAGAACGTRVPEHHRASEGPACPKERGAGDYALLCTIDGGVRGTECVRDSDCTQGINGRCLASPPPITPCAGGCTYDECFHDAECGGNTPCACRSSASDGVANRCLPSSNCRLDADCGPGAYCSPSQIHTCIRLCPEQCPTGGGCFANGQPVPCACSTNCRTGYFCHSACDDCVDDADCDGGACTHLNDGGWACLPCGDIP